MAKETEEYVKSVLDLAEEAVEDQFQARFANKGLSPEALASIRIVFAIGFNSGVEFGFQQATKELDKRLAALYKAES